MDDSAPTQPVPAPMPQRHQADVFVNESDMQHLFNAASTATSPSRDWQPPTVEALQKMLPQYDISAFVARGGMGVVYKGEQRALKRAVAIKVLPPDIDDGDMHFAERFKQEAQSMARLSHPNIVSVFEAGETPDGLLYFVMEFIEGTDVQQMIAGEGKLEPQHALSIIAHVCDALAFAHEEGVIHRDIKPSNIMVDKKGRVKVADFGLAKAVNVESTMLTSANVAMGTPDFIAPESLITGARVDHRADLYALGVMLYVMLTGQIPRGRFQMPTGMIPKLDPRYDAIVDKAMQTDRELRYASAGAMRTDIDRILTQPVPAQMQTIAQTAAGGVGTPGSSTLASIQRRRRLLAAGAITMLVVIAGAGELLYKHSHASHGPDATTALKSSRPDAIKLWDVPEKVTLKPGVEWKDGALVLGGPTWGTMRFGEPKSRDAIIRASIRMNLNADRPQIGLRLTRPGGTERLEDQPRYMLGIRAGERQVALRMVTQGDVQTDLQTWPLPRAYGVDEWARLELKAVGDELTATLDGQVLGVVHNSTQTGAGEVFVFARANGWFRDIEYVPLDKSLTAEPSPGRKATPLEPRAIRLWDSPDKVPKRSGVHWENGSLRIDRDSVQYYGTCNRDAILRAELRYNPEITSSGLSLRARFGDATSSYYVFSIARGALQISVDTSPARAPATVRKTLKTWPVPASIKADQWVQMEFRVVGRTLTAMLDGEILGSVEDGALTEAGGAVVHSNSTGFFRNIVYVPLDPVPPLEPGTLKLWTDTASLPAQEGVSWQKGTIHLQTKATLRHNGADSRDAILRADIRRNPDRSGAGIYLRHRVDAATKVEDCYRLILNQPAVALSLVHAGKITELKSWPLHAPATNDDWVHLELRAIGDTFTVMCDGQQLGTVKDATLTAPGAVALSAAADGWFRYVTYTPLDKPAGAPPSKP
ncbi:MAG: protein kinase [Verrucomicrobiaceae bacterium]|nr:protein kinase [Verrucomicrobiaceae bacterium]